MQILATYMYVCCPVPYLPYLTSSVLCCSPLVGSRGLSSTSQKSRIKRCFSLQNPSNGQKNTVLGLTSNNTFWFCNLLLMRLWGFFLSWVSAVDFATNFRWLLLFDVVLFSFVLAINTFDSIGDWSSCKRVTVFLLYTKCTLYLVLLNLLEIERLQNLSHIVVLEYVFNNFNQSISWPLKSNVD